MFKQIRMILLCLFSLLVLSGCTGRSEVTSTEPVFDHENNTVHWEIRT